MNRFHGALHVPVRVTRVAVIALMRLLTPEPAVPQNVYSSVSISVEQSW